MKTTEAALVNKSVTIHSLAVRKFPRSGKPAELLDFEEINAAAIVRAIKSVVKKTL